MYFCLYIFVYMYLVWSIDFVIVQGLFEFFVGVFIDIELSGRLGIRDGVNVRVLLKNEENYIIQNILLLKNIFSNFFYNKKLEGVNKKKRNLKKCKNMKKNNIFYIKG